MDDKELRFQAYKLAQTAFFRENSPERLRDITENIVRVADFIIAYVNNEHEPIMEENRAKGEELAKRLIQPVIWSAPPKRRWWKKGN